VTIIDKSLKFKISCYKYSGNTTRCQYSELPHLKSTPNSIVASSKKVLENILIKIGKPLYLKEKQSFLIWRRKEAMLTMWQKTCPFHERGPGEV